MKIHADDKWINSKGGSGGYSYSYNSVNGLAQIGYIYGKSKLRIAYYNFILLLRYIGRII